MNRFEQEGRERKANAVARLIWRSIEREQRTNRDLPAAVADQPQTERDSWLRLAGYKKGPSGATWNRVVELIRERVLDERRWLDLDESRPVGAQRTA